MIDGCPLLCARNCLARHGIEPTLHWQLAEHGVKKRYHHDVDPGQARTMTAVIAQDIRALAASMGQGAVQDS